MDRNVDQGSLEPDDVETQAENEEGVGLLGAAFLSAGFGADGSLPDPETEPVVEAAPRVEPDPPPAPAAKSRKTAKTRKAPATKGRAEEAAKETATAVLPPIVEEELISPYDKPGQWFVIHAYSGYEKKVKANLATRTSSMHMQDRIFEVVIPTEKVVEIKGGRKVEVEKRMFPGYLLIRMYLDDDSWHAVRDTPGVTSFVGMGTGNKPTSLSKREVERFLGLKKEAAKKPPRFRPAWAIGETVRVSSGPFADFNGVVEDINVDQQKVTVLVEIFGRDTPMELGFEQIQKQ
ncbi:MAG: transcription termination/antitermination protein NusG [bacterium]|nr:transcription termination/antitermination protein NusG [bacterium]